MVWYERIASPDTPSTTGVSTSGHLSNLPEELVYDDFATVSSSHASLSTQIRGNRTFGLGRALKDSRVNSFSPVSLTRAHIYVGMDKVFKYQPIHQRKCQNLAPKHPSDLVFWNPQFTTEFDTDDRVPFWSNISTEKTAWQGFSTQTHRHTKTISILPISHLSTSKPAFAPWITHLHIQSQQTETIFSMTYKETCRSHPPSLTTWGTSMAPTIPTHFRIGQSRTAQPLRYSSPGPEAASRTRMHNTIGVPLVWQYIRIPSTSWNGTVRLRCCSCLEHRLSMTKSEAGKECRRKWAVDGNGMRAMVSACWEERSDEVHTYHFQGVQRLPAFSSECLRHRTSLGNLGVCVRIIEYMILLA